ncbi:MAG: hypothetical protein JST75_22070 [Bacteroidetes bacterium]|nr:hypothetical protein [Bacteroidota bacterium]
MDSKLIKQFGTDILCYRIRSARQKVRMQYKDFDKQMISLSKEEKKLYRQKRNLGWDELTPPIQKGWKRFFVLRDDVARSNNADFYENILKKINTHVWSHKKDFKIKKRRRGRKRYIVQDQYLLRPERYHFLRLGFSEAEKQLFHIEYHVEKWSDKPVMRYVFSEPWRYVLRIRPNMIDKVRKRDEVLEARIKQINNYMVVNDFRKRQAKLLTGYYQYRFGKVVQKYNEKNPLRNKSIQRILDETKIETV